MRAFLLTFALLGTGMFEGCLHHAAEFVVEPSVVLPGTPQQTLALVALNDRAAPPFATAFFHDALSAALRRTQGFQVLDYAGPWPEACAHPIPGSAVDLRLLVADIQRTCPAAVIVLYEVTQLTTVRPMRLGIRIVMLGGADAAPLIDYDGVWDAPVGPPAPIPRGSRLGFLFPPVFPPHDPVAEISPRLLGERAAHDIALMIGQAPVSPVPELPQAAPASDEVELPPLLPVQPPAVDLPPVPEDSPVISEPFPVIE